MRYLIVAAHPDDEVLGAGATMYEASKKGDEVYVCMLSHWSPTRDDNLEKGIAESHKKIGVKKCYTGDFGCMRFKDADHHEIVRFIEAAIKDCKPDIVITHHPADVHIDHGVASECCMEAIKLPMRQISDVPPIKSVMYMEVPSSTDWNINPSTRKFEPNTYMEIGWEAINAKIEAISVYDKVLRERPHPRSVSSLEALAVVRGSQGGVKYAESFQSVFRLGV